MAKAELGPRNCLYPMPTTHIGANREGLQISIMQLQNVSHNLEESTREKVGEAAECRGALKGQEGGTP